MGVSKLVGVDVRERRVLILERVDVIVRRGKLGGG